MGLDLDLVCKHCNHSVAEFNYTYNVAPMWFAVASSDTKMVEIEGLSGFDSIPKLQIAIKRLELDPEKFLAMNPENGWGSYATFVPWLYKLLVAAKEHPNLIWSACR